MKSEDIFAMGLGLHAPWEVKSVSFEHEPQSALKRFTRMLLASSRAKNLLWVSA